MNNRSTGSGRAARVNKEHVRALRVLVGAIGLTLLVVGTTVVTGAAPSVEVHVVSTSKSAGGPAITTVACMSVGNCVLAGYGTNDHVFLWAERAGISVRAFNPLEHFTKALGPTLNSLSCFRGGCLGFGQFTPSMTSKSVSYFTASYSGGAWHPAKIDRLDLGSAKGFDVSGLSCRDNRNCIAVGRLPYSPDSVNYSDFVSAPGILTMTNGRWGSPTVVGSKVKGFPAGFADISCPSWGNCVAVGIGKVDGHLASLEAKETHGIWSSVGAPFPKTWEVLSVSCPATTDCSVGGRTDTPQHSEAFVSSEQSGRWLHAVPVGAVWTVKKGYTASSANLLSCSSATTCVVAGLVDGPRPTMSGKVSVSSVAWVANEANGAWDSGALIGFRPGHINQGQLDGLSCPSPTSCVVVGRSGIKNAKLTQIGRSDNFVATVTP